ncbi:MAG: bifunctional adenosylcobinamide kinase/adenosylcobinamide-phosphate guanylyltransferase [Syntrophobacteraceae bacterium]|jgi:adenosylcobinamide kinase/adenosylcobinamide-phosphate guanylyltransferase
MTITDLDLRTPLLVLGGAKSGKSTWAESVVNSFAPPYIYVATAQGFDDEMKLRIERHRERRKDMWETIESPAGLQDTLKSLNGRSKAVLLDCITLWLSNLLCSESAEPEASVEGLCKVIEAVDYPLVIVSNEVGAGIVPDNPLARKFRDLSGSTNQRLARICASVYLVTAGLPLRLK